MMKREDIYLVLVTGSRDYGTMQQRLKIEGDLRRCMAKAREQEKTLVVIHGDARGADRLGGDIADRIGAFVGKFPAPWHTRQRSAGPLRNSVMAALFEFDEILAYPLGQSKGTHDMIRKARKIGGLFHEQSE